MAKGLTRGDNIEEGHYMERLWAALLSQRLPEQLQHKIVCVSTGVVTKYDNPFVRDTVALSGQLRGCDCARLEQATANSDTTHSCIVKLQPLKIYYLKINTTDHISFQGEYSTLPGR